MDMKTETGVMRVSTPEQTALDLLQYLRGAGQLGNAATVLAELTEKIDAQRLADTARAEGDVRNAQRLGSLLERVGGESVLGPLAAWVQEQHPRTVPLRPDRSWRRSAKDSRWHVYVNEAVEAES
jgi:hypothetical protein